MACHERQELSDPGPGTFQCDCCINQYSNHQVASRTLSCYKHNICGFCDRPGVQESMLKCPMCDGSDRSTLTNYDVSRKTILLVMDCWDDVMSSTSSVGQDLASCLGRLGVANILCIVTRAQVIDILDARVRGVTLVECKNNADVNRIRAQLVEIDALIGFVPLALEMTHKIRVALQIRKVMLVCTDIYEGISEQQNATVWSLGPHLFNSLEAHIRDLEHILMVPPIDENIRLGIPEKRVEGFTFIFPMIIQQKDLDYLGNHGFDTGLAAIRKFADLKKIDPIVTFLVQPSLINNVDEIINFANKFGIHEPRVRFPGSKREWLQEIIQSNLALCTSRTAGYQHWVHIILNHNLPFLVSAESGMGKILVETHSVSVVQTNISYAPGITSDADHWCNSIQHAFANADCARIDHCYGNGMFLRQHRDGYQPLLNKILDIYELILRPIEDPNQPQIARINKILRDRFQRLSHVITSRDILDTAKICVELKCISHEALTRTDLDAEKALLNLYRDFQSLGLVIMRIDHGSLVFKVLAKTKEAAHRFEELHEDGQLFQLIKRHCLQEHVPENSHFELLLHKLNQVREPDADISIKHKEKKIKSGRHHGPYSATYSTVTGNPIDKHEERVAESGAHSSASHLESDVYEKPQASILGTGFPGATLVHTCRVPHHYESIWPTQETSIFALGSIKDSMIGLITDKGELILDGVKQSSRVCSGLWVGGTKHVVTTHKDVNIVDINTKNKTIQARQRIDVAGKPLRVFNIDASRFGIFALGRPTEPLSHIHIHSKNDEQLIGTIDVELSDASNRNTVAVSPAGDWVIASWRHNEIYRFSSDGKLKDKIGSSAVSLDDIVPGHLLSPRDVRVDEDNAVVVTTEDGTIHRYHDNSWTIVASLAKNVRAVYLRNSELFALGANEFNKFQI